MLDKSWEIIEDPRPSDGKLRHESPETRLGDELRQCSAEDKKEPLRAVHQVPSDTQGARVQHMIDSVGAGCRVVVAKQCCHEPLTWWNTRSQSMVYDRGKKDHRKSGDDVAACGCLRICQMVFLLHESPLGASNSDVDEHAYNARLLGLSCANQQRQRDFTAAGFAKSEGAGRGQFHSGLHFSTGWCGRADRSARTCSGKTVRLSLFWCVALPKASTVFFAGFWKDHVERWTLSSHDDFRIVPHSVEERCSSLETNLAPLRVVVGASGDTWRISWMTSISTSTLCASMAAFARAFLKAALSSTSTCTPRRAMLPSGRCFRTSTTVPSFF